MEPTGSGLYEEGLHDSSKEEVTTQNASSEKSQWKKNSDAGAAGLECKNEIVESADDCETGFNFKEMFEDLSAEDSWIRKMSCMSYFDLTVECRDTNDFHIGLVLRLPVEETLTQPPQEYEYKCWLKNILIEYGMPVGKSIVFAKMSSSFSSTNFRKDLSKDVKEVTMLLNSVLFMCEHGVDAYVAKCGQGRQLESVFDFFINVLKGKPNNASPVYKNPFDHFAVIVKLLTEIRVIIVEKLKLSNLKVAEGLQMSLSALKEQFDSRCLNEPLTSMKYLNINKFTTGLDAYSSLAFTIAGLNYESFSNIQDYKDMEDCARKASRLGFDISSFFTASHIGIMDNNFVLIQTCEKSWSVNEAFLFAVSSQNKFILRMCFLKDQILENKDRLKTVPDLLPAVNILMEFAQGCMDYGFNCTINKIRAVITAERRSIQVARLEKCIDDFISQQAKLPSF